jgi:hypothetical protein
MGSAIVWAIGWETHHNCTLDHPTFWHDQQRKNSNVTSGAQHVTAPGLHVHTGVATECRRYAAVFAGVGGTRWRSAGVQVDVHGKSSGTLPSLPCMDYYGLSVCHDYVMCVSVNGCRHKWTLLV